MRCHVFVFFVFLAVLPALSYGADSWSAEAMLGAVYNFNTRLRLDQGGYGTIVTTARYDTHPFEQPLYYALRVSRWTGDKAWEGMLIHDKLYLANPPPEVQGFSITHGFNILGITRATRGERFTYRFGAGVVITHAEGTVRGVQYDGGYELSGVSLIAGISKRFYISGPWFVVAELMGTLSYAEPNLGGTPELKASVPNAAIHGHIGIGYDF